MQIHHHSENVALTLGADGSIIMHEGKAVSMEAVDTTGADDMYAAGLLYGITNGLTWKQSGHLRRMLRGACAEGSLNGNKFHTQKRRARSVS